MIKKIFFTAVSFLTLNLVFIDKVRAQAENLGVNDLANTNLGTRDLVAIVSSLINIFLGFLGIIALVLIIYAGWLWMSSQGDAEKIQKAKLILTSSTIGLVIILSAFIIARFVISKIYEATGGNQSGPNQEVIVPPPLVIPSCPEPEDLTELSICKIKPDADSATVGQYITIEGWHFADYGPNSAVKFDNNLAELVSCDGQVSWREIDPNHYPGYYRVKVVVPNIPLADYKVNVFADAGQQGIYPAGAFDYFEIVAGSPRPSIACISPDAQNRGERVNIEGRGFGNNGTIHMNGWVDASTSEISFSDISSWSDTLITGALLPQAALSSDLTVEVDGEVSNPEWLRVSCSDSETDCASNCCAANSCVTANACFVAAGLENETGPIITSISSDTGKEGNLLTVYGRNFGDTAGSVVFQNNVGGEVSGINPATISSACSDYWTDQRIIIVVPENVKDATLVSGAQVWVRTEAGDDSNFKTFYDNGDDLPGLCRVEPASGSFGQQVTLHGIKFANGNKASFGGILSNNTNFVSINELNTKIPNVNAGELSVWVQDSSGHAGNSLDFTVNGVAGGDPVIQELSPDNGPEGQYLTIFGANFGNEPGLVNFSRGGVDVPADLSFPAQCTANYWHHNSIVVKVPDLAGPATDYQISVKRSSDAKVSNSKSFNNTLGSPGPGLCYLQPDNGPANDTFAITLAGDNFGTTQNADDAVVFRVGEVWESASINDWSNQSIVARVPVNAVSGPVAVENNNVYSNTLNFQVNSCTNNNDCGTGRECCLQDAGNYCAATGSCPSTSACSYSWEITTAAEPFTLVQDYSCSNNLQSPSPWPDALDGTASRDAYTDANIVALFTRDVVDADFDLANINVKVCNTGNEFEDSACNASVVGEISIINHNSDREGFVFNPNSNLNSDRWYKVTLGAFHSEIGHDVWNGADFVWHFKTQGATCQPSSIHVGPERDLYVGEVAEFNASVQGANCNVCGSAYNWGDWTLPVAADHSKAEIVGQNTNATNIASVQIRGSQVTENSTPPTIQLQAELNGLTDSVYPIIKDAILRKLDNGPDCQQSCVNAGVWVKFNTRIDVNTANNTSISIKECSDQTCASLVGNNLVSDITFDATGKEMYLAHSDFKAETSYLVAINTNLKNVAGYSLASALEWDFTTSNLSDCAVERVEINPSFYHSYTLNESIAYTAEVYSEPNSCDANGQMLVADDYQWSWSSLPNTVASVNNLSVQPNVSVLTLAEGVAEVRAEISNAPINDLQAEGKFATGDLLISLDDASSNPVPHVVSHSPITPACLNAAMVLEFDQKMDVASLQSSVKLYKRSNFNAEGCLLISNAAEEITQNFWSNLKSIFNLKAQAQATTYWCPVAGDYAIFNRNSGTKVIFYPSNDLSANGQYLGVVYPSAKSLRNVLLDPGQINYDYNADGINDFYAWSFNTTDQVCQVSFVTVDPNPDLFSCSRNNCAGDLDTTLAGNQHKYTAEAYDPSGQVLNMDSYQWFEHNNLLNLESETGSSIFVTATNENGSTNLIVEASDDVAGSATGSARVDLFMCENPWPRPDPGPFPYNFNNSPYNFDTYYCQDAGTAGSSLLPYLQPPRSRGMNGMTLAEFIFVVDPQVVAVLDTEQNIQKVAWWQKILAKFKPKALADVLPMAPPIAPSDLNLLENNNTGVTIQWTDNSSSEDGFKIYRKANNADWVQIGTTTDAKFADASVVADAIYSYRVLAFEGNLESAFSNTITVTAMASSLDVIGVRVMANAEHLSARDWYQKYAPNSDSPGQDLEINGYQALKVANTVYIAAANVDLSGERIYTNIYIFSYNLGARQSTQAIFNALVNNVSLSNNIESHNVCLADANRACASMFDCADLEPSTCNADGLKLRRDTQRLADLVAIKKQLDFYGQLHKACDTNINVSCSSDSQCPNGGHCLAYYPLLNSGTYVPGMSVSKWPSWQTEFAQTINLPNLAQDPINKFTGCPSPYDPETCWSESSNSFYCPAGSMVYLYKKEAGVDAYSLDANFEFSFAGIDFTKLEPAVSTNIQFNNDQYCHDTAAIGGSMSDPDCGNGIIDGSEQCDGGFRNLCDVSLGNQNWWNERLGGCYPPGSMNASGESIECTWYTPSPALTAAQCGNACGDHVLNSVHELCEYSDAAGVIDFGGSEYACLDGSTPTCNSCLPLCADGSLAGVISCGDGLVQGSERCEIASYSSPNPAQSNVNNQYQCSNSCQNNIGGYCGDGVEQSIYGETCDGGSTPCVLPNGYNGSIGCANCQESNVCVATESCGDGSRNGTEQCDGADLAGQSCVTLGWDQGTLSCSNSCNFNEANCSEIAGPSIEATIFVTSAEYSGDLVGAARAQGYLGTDGLEAADYLCQRHANNAPAGNVKAGTWKAWLSNLATNAKDRLSHNSMNYKLVSGDIVANGWTDLVDGSLLDNSIDISENNTVISEYVHSNTDAYGSRVTANADCDNWSSSTSSNRPAQEGHSSVVNALYPERWTVNSGQNPRCSYNFPLYCLWQQPYNNNNNNNNNNSNQN